MIQCGIKKIDKEGFMLGKDKIVMSKLCIFVPSFSVIALIQLMPYMCP